MRKRVLGLFATLLITFAVFPATAHAANGREMYRLYNPNSGEHFYTASTAERDHLVEVGWYMEGVGWVAPTSSNTPVYRLYNRNAGDHHYTTNAAEKNMLVRVGWSYEGIGWYSDDAKRVPLYRQYNPNAYSRPGGSGAHNYTTNRAENDMLVGVGWRAEGVGWYAIGAGYKINYNNNRYYSKGFPTLKSVGINYGSNVDTAVDAELRNLVQLLKQDGIDLSEVNSLSKAAVVKAYVSQKYAPGDASYDALGMIRQGNGTCFAYSDLVLCMLRKLGVDAQFTVTGRHVAHDGKSYGSQHRSVIVAIDGKYYDIDANIGFYDMMILGQTYPEQIHASYANYLLGKSNSYSQIAP